MYLTSDIAALEDLAAELKIDLRKLDDSVEKGKHGLILEVRECNYKYQNGRNKCQQRTWRTNHGF